MSLVFPYTCFPVATPVLSLGGRLDRPYAFVGVTVIGPTGAFYDQCRVDTGADETVFPDRVAGICGIDLTRAPSVSLTAVGSAATVIRFAQVVLRITDGVEQREWTAWVGFTSAQLKKPLLGFAGVLQFFDATFFGEREEVELAINGLYPGT